MKGLLLKDFYMMVKYCRSFLLIAVIFNLAAAFGAPYTFYMLYPMILSGMIPVTLLSYDARFKWTSYAYAFPYTAKQTVSSKYVIAICTTLLSTLLCIVVQTGKALYAGTPLTEMTEMFLVLIPVALIVPAVLLPIVFRFGAEKGRIIYLGIVGLLCGLFAVGVTVTGGSEYLTALITTMQKGALLPVSALLFGFSWLIAVRVYKPENI